MTDDEFEKKASDWLRRIEIAVCDMKRNSKDREGKHILIPDTSEILILADHCVNHIRNVRKRRG